MYGAKYLRPISATIDIRQYVKSLRNSEPAKRLESYSLNIFSEDIADKQYFKDGESFVSPYCMAGDEIF